MAWRKVMLSYCSIIYIIYYSNLIISNSGIRQCDSSVTKLQILQELERTEIDSWNTWLTKTTTTKEMLWMMTHSCNLSTMERKMIDLWGSLGSQPGWHGELARRHSVPKIKQRCRCVRWSYPSTNTSFVCPLPNCHPWKHAYN